MASVGRPTLDESAHSCNAPSLPTGATAGKRQAQERVQLSESATRSREHLTRPCDQRGAGLRTPTAEQGHIAPLAQVHSTARGPC
jgi:hypothetical protein